MTLKRKIEWLMLALTAGLLVLLDWLHLGVIHYNIFLLSLLAWSLVLILTFRALTTGSEKGEKGG
jgi:hypothetical protein